MDGSSTKIIVGHYGSGKTEFAINYAFHQRALGHEVAIADLDIVNPYFRVRQKYMELEKAGITVISNNFRNDWKVDIPALDRMIESCFTNHNRINVMDVGGNGVGARVLSRFRETAMENDYDMWMVVNARRYETQGVEQTLAFMRDIEAQSRMRINGMINNTHLLRDTTVDDILAGEEIIREIHAKTGIPCHYTSCMATLMDTLSRHRVSGALFPITLHMRPRYI